MSLEIFVRQKLSCPRHPRYNPDRDGEAAIKGGCEICRDLLQICKECAALEAMVHITAEKIVDERNRVRA
jgi:hypothetical protein